MKITGTNSYEPNFLLNSKVSNDRIVINKEQMHLADKNITVSISREGMQKYRASVQKTSKPLDIAALQEKKEYLSKSVVDPAHGMTEDFHQRLLKFNSEKGKKEHSAESMMTNCATVYASMYDEIKSGYEQGTREFWVIDDKSENGFRKVTEEEELAALDEAYDFYSYVTEGYVNYGMKSRDAIESALSGTWQQKVREEKQAEDQKAENAESIQAIYQKLQKIRENIQEQYAGGKRSISGMVMNAVMLHLG